MKLSLSPWWFCLLALPIAAFLILGPSRERSRPRLSPTTEGSHVARQQGFPALSAHELTEREGSHSAILTQKPITESSVAEAKPEEPSPEAPSLEIGPDQTVPAAFASFAKDFTPQEISIAQQLRQTFYETVAAMSPKDPDFTAKWNAAQQANDDLYRLYYGKDRYLAQHRKAYTESFADQGQQPEH